MSKLINHLYTQLPTTKRSEFIYKLKLRFGEMIYGRRINPICCCEYGKEIKCIQTPCPRRSFWSITLRLFKRKD